MTEADEERRPLLVLSDMGVREQNVMKIDESRVRRGRGRSFKKRPPAFGGPVGASEGDLAKWRCGKIPISGAHIERDMVYRKGETKKKAFRPKK